MNISLKNEKETVKSLMKKEGYKELYVVNVYTENEVAGTHQFYVYATKDEAVNYIHLCEQYYESTAQQYKKIKDGFTYVANGVKMKNWFTLTRWHHKRAA